MAAVTSPPTLTNKQRLALMIVSQYYARNGEPCSATYVARRLQLSRQNTHRHLQALARVGLVQSTSCLRPTSEVVTAVYSGG